MVFNPKWTLKQNGVMNGGAFRIKLWKISNRIVNLPIYLLQVPLSRTKSPTIAEGNVHISYQIRQGQYEKAQFICDFTKTTVLELFSRCISMFDFKATKATEGYIIMNKSSQKADVLMIDPKQTLQQNGFTPNDVYELAKLDFGCGPPHFALEVPSSPSTLKEQRLHSLNQQQLLNQNNQQRLQFLKQLHEQQQLRNQQRLLTQQRSMNDQRFKNDLSRIKRPVVRVHNLLVLSICVKDYPFDTREGCDADVRYINTTFGPNRFRCKMIERNGTVDFAGWKRSIIAAQHELLRHRNTNQYDGFLFLFSGHGTSSTLNPSASVLSLSDGQNVPVTDILDAFSNGTTGLGKSFCGKPRLYVIQACRGSNEVQAVVPGNEDRYELSDPPVQEKKVYHPDDDVMIIQSSTPRYVSYRDKKNGSYLIRAFCKVLSDSMHSNGRNGFALDDAVYVIKNKVTGYSEGKQSVVSTSTLRSRLILK